MEERVTTKSELTVKSIKHETPKSWLAVLEDNSEVWFPKSQCTLEDNTLTVPDWLIEAKNLNVEE